ncbi:hypothetical protein [Rheinheimera sp. WS51]|uniref:hypothetical protein n=1 Tax=Rheinheimera sp. WS51 TaxID=3425886 RepID=UPI003D8F1D26
MKNTRGMVLVISLVVLLSLSLIMVSSLYVSQLTQKSANAGQQQLQITHQAYTEHLSSLTITEDLAAEDFVVCPAEYAAWSEAVLRCKAVLVSTETYDPSHHFYSGYSSVLLQQTLIAGERVDDLD